MSYYAEKDFFEDDQLIELVNRVLSGELTLAWYRVEAPRVRAKAADLGRGLTYADCNLGPYGYDAIPEFVRDRYSMAARGSALTAKLPDLGYTINRLSDVWSDNVVALYEEAKARYAPFTRLVAEDIPNRVSLARLCLDAVARGRPVWRPTSMRDSRKRSRRG